MGEKMSDESEANDRRTRGLEMYQKVYGDHAVLPEGGSTEFFDLLIIDQQFSEVWSREALDIPSRRLLTMGVLAATRRFDSYLGTPSSGDLYQASQRAIAAHRADNEHS
jgi:alkylhydroperoxidase/carboxymuconolactone decarboxylase family protein YurZ